MNTCKCESLIIVIGLMNLFKEKTRGVTFDN